MLCVSLMVDAVAVSWDYLSTLSVCLSGSGTLVYCMKTAEVIGKAFSRQGLSPIIQVLLSQDITQFERNPPAPAGALVHGMGKT